MNQMDSKEFVRLQVVEQRGMVERGEVMPALMIEPAEEQLCFWCGDATDLLLFGPARTEGKKAFKLRQLATTERWPETLTQNPCQSCSEILGRGICFVEADADAQPTGRWWLLPERAVRTLVRFDSLADEIVTRKKTLIVREDADRMGLFDRER